MRPSAILLRHRLAQRLTRGLWLATLAVVLALHPAAGAGEGVSLGLAGLLKELLCGCGECTGGKEALAQSEPSCCGRRAERPAPIDAGCSEGGACTCSHPDRVPVPDDGPLCATTGGGDGADPLAQLDVTHDVLQGLPLQVSGGVLVVACGDLSPPGDLDPAAPDATRPAGALPTGARLARLSTLLL